MTPRWAAPEGIDAKQASSPSMDVYVLGLLAFFALTGGSPFRSFGTGSVNLTALRSELAQPFGSMAQRAAELGYRFSPALNAWFETSLASRTEARFESVLDQASALASMNPTVARVAAKKPEPAPPTRRLPPTRRPAPSRPAMRMLPEPNPSQGNAPSSLIPPSVFDVPERAVALVSAQPLLLMPSLSPPAPPSTNTTPDAPPQLSRIEVRENRLVFLVVAGGLLSICGIAVMVWLLALKAAAPEPARTPPVPKLAAQPLTQPKAPVESVANVERQPVSVLPASEASGTVRFRCEPHGCDSVYCDGKPIAVTDDAVALSAGTHTCKAMKTGFRTSSQRFTLGSEAIEKVFVQFAGKNKVLQSAHSAPQKTTSKRARQFPSAP